MVSRGDVMLLSRGTSLYTSNGGTFKALASELKV